MVETLEAHIEHAASQPKAPRAPLYREILRSETFLLSLDAPISGEAVRVTRAGQSFAIWADKDPEMGGVWVPVFPARDTVAEFVAAKRLRAPQGKEFLWMGHQPGAVFPLLRRVKHFAGIRLYLRETAAVSLSWSEVKALSDRVLPSDAPEVYELPVARLLVPKGARVAFGRVDAGPGRGPGRLLCLPEAGRFGAQDLRKLVRLDLGEEGTAWMACRHFLQALRFLKGGPGADAGRYLEELLRSLVGFEMYGEAEALCDWLARKGNEAYAWICQAAIYGKTGRLDECATLCRRGAAKYPQEKAFYINGARALIGLGRREEALRMVRIGLQEFPGEASLTALSGDLTPPA